MRLQLLRPGFVNRATINFGQNYRDFGGIRAALSGWATRGV
jgi:hypothetical protein